MIVSGQNQSLYASNPLQPGLPLLIISFSLLRGCNTYKRPPTDKILDLPAIIIAMASKPPTTQASEREARLSKLLQAYITGAKSPKTAKDGKLLLEAICTQDDRASCAERLVASKDALESLKLALRFEKTTEFFNTTLKDFLEFLQSPAIAPMCAGEVLKQLLTILVCPETVWSALVAAHANRQLNSEGELGFAWLLLQLTSWVDDPPINVENIAHELTQKKSFLDADDRDLRTIGYRIAHVLDAKKTVTADDGPGPGGRHDNDHANFRRVTIFPTDDELMSTETSFYRPADAIVQVPFAQRPGVHLDNQFRLLREDFLAELKEDVNASQIKRRVDDHVPASADSHWLVLTAVMANSEAAWKSSPVERRPRRNAEPF
jgi:hypothetical protein